MKQLLLTLLLAGIGIPAFAVCIPNAPPPNVDTTLSGRKIMVANVSINGGGNYDSLGLGAAFTLDFSYTIDPVVTACAGCVTYFYYGVGGTFVAGNANPGPYANTSCFQVFAGMNGNESALFTAPMTPGYYYITLSSDWSLTCYEHDVEHSNCYGDAIALIKVGNPPGMSVTTVSVTDASNCMTSDGSINISVAGGSGCYIYQWSNSNSNQNVSALSKGNYSVIVSDGNCDTTINFLIDAPGSIDLDTSAVVVLPEHCSQADGSITGIQYMGGTLPLVFDWDDGISIISSSNTTPDLTNAAAGTYNLTVTDDVGCQAIAGPYVIQAIPGPDIVLNGLIIADAHCGKADGNIKGITLNGGMGAFTFEWSDTGGVVSTSTSNADLLSTVAGNYTLIVTDVQGCTDTTGPHILNDIPAPAIDLSGIQLSDVPCGNPEGSITGIQVTGGTPPLLYEWSEGINLISTSSITPDLTNLAAGTYTLTITDSFACMSTAGPFLLTQLPGPTISLLSDTNVRCKGGKDGSILVEAVDGTLPYTFDGGGQQNGTGIFEQLSAGEHTIIVEDKYGCADTLVTTLTQPDEIDLNVIPAQPNCGQPDGRIIVEASGGVGGFMYSINGGGSFETNAVFEGLPADYYPVWVRDSNDCVALGQYVELAGTPEVVVTVGADTSVASGDSVLLDGSYSSGTQFFWAPSEGLSCDDCVDPIAAPAAPTLYVLTVTDEGTGCFGSDSVFVDINLAASYFVPNAFTPNQDGENDIYYVYGKNIEELQYAIYDRWGEKVFASGSADHGWDGTLNGRPVNTGVFLVLGAISFKDGTNVEIHKKLKLIR